MWPTPGKCFDHNQKVNNKRVAKYVKAANLVLSCVAKLKKKIVQLVIASQCDVQCATLAGGI